MSQVQGRKIAIIGASGNLGAPMLATLLANGAHTITAVKRPESTSSFSSEVIVKAGNLEDEAFLTEVFKGQDAVILAPPLSHVISIQDPAVRAAAKAGVPYVIPAEYGPSPFATELIQENGLLQAKQQIRDLIDELGVSSWISITVGAWLDVNLSNGLWRIDAKARKASMYRGADGRVSTSSVAHAGQAVAAVLSLPEADLARYKKQAVYTPSFHITHREMLDAVQRATKTTGADWDITYRDANEALKEYNEAIGQGDVFSSYHKFILTHLVEGKGADFEDKVDLEVLKKLEALGLQKENLEEVVERILQ
ncbi:NAD(P)-binding domain-containing [Fusarium albosuccineum]|uniref:NAD(P)-binding domain-containing n=1 Tax=Fusarium albosuccineum TaxID=1237068 RepID=A0A8H4L5C2_9HYPO|nr:NAD(P)-binding domain-containing [Fusarium albosuccineum]